MRVTCAQGPWGCTAGVAPVVGEEMHTRDGFWNPSFTGIMSSSTQEQSCSAALSVMQSTQMAPGTGVTRGWAVQRQPSTRPSSRRLSVLAPCRA